MTKEQYSEEFKEQLIKFSREVLPMKKYLLSLVFAIYLICSLSTSVMAANPIDVTLNGEHLQFDVPPVLENGRVLVPLRTVFEALGATVEWDGTTSTVTAIRGNDNVKLTIGKSTAYKNGVSMELDVTAKVIDGRTLVPVRFVSEALGALVEWDTQNKSVNITQRSELELQAMAQVEKYLSLLNRAVSVGVFDEEWEGVLSQAALNSGYGIDARVFRPMPGLVGSSGRAITDAVIMKSEPVSPDEIIVTARYIYYDPTMPDVSRNKLQYEKKYYLVNQQGQLLLDREEVVKETPVK